MPISFKTVSTSAVETPTSNKKIALYMYTLTISDFNPIRSAGRMEALVVKILKKSLLTAVFSRTFPSGFRFKALKPKYFMKDFLFFVLKICLLRPSQKTSCSQFWRKVTSIVGIDEHQLPVSLVWLHNVHNDVFHVKLFPCFSWCLRPGWKTVYRYSTKHFSKKHSNFKSFFIVELQFFQKPRGRLIGTLMNEMQPAVLENKSFVHQRKSKTFGHFGHFSP